MNKGIIEKCIKKPQLLKLPEGCLTYESIYLAQKNRTTGNQMLPIPVLNLELENKRLYGDSPTWFACFDDIASLTEKSNLSVNLFKNLISSLKAGDQNNNGGSFNYILK